jgi:hypothetical protein
MADLVMVIEDEKEIRDPVRYNLERVADLATNIGEEVVFIAEARVIKHHAEEMDREGGSAPA